MPDGNPTNFTPQNRAASSHLQIRFYSEKERRLQNATARKKACWLGFLPVLSVDRQAKQPLCCPVPSGHWWVAGKVPSLYTLPKVFEFVQKQDLAGRCLLCAVVVCQCKRVRVISP